MSKVIKRCPHCGTILSYSEDREYYYCYKCKKAYTDLSLHLHKLRVKGYIDD